MEARRVRAVLVLFVVLGLLVGQSTANIVGCYATCFLPCVITPGSSAFSCALKCMKNCILPFKSLDGNNNLQQTHYFCKLGCATSSCSKLSSRDDPREEKVASCVDSCSTKCTKNFST